MNPQYVTPFRYVKFYDLQNSSRAPIRRLRRHLLQ